MKLRTKIQFFLSLIMVTVIVLINTAVYFLFYNISLDAEIERLETQTSSVMDALAAEDNTEADPQQLLTAYLPANGMIRVINEENNVIAAVSKQAEYYNLPFSFTQSFSEEIVEEEDGSRHILISVPLIWSNGEIVTLQVTDHLVSLHETMSTLRLVLVAAALIMVIPAVIAGGWLGNVLIKPIRQLTYSMTDNPREGEWKKIDTVNRSKDELYQMSNTYNQMIDRLNENFSRQQQFVSDASHELKTPISVVKSYTQLLKRRGKEKPEIFEEAVQAIQSEADRMQHMVEQMLALAKNQQRENLQFEVVDIIALTKDVIRALTVAYNRKITLYSDLQKLEISLDREKIHQALYILVDNACKYSEEEVMVEIDQQDKKVELRVQDYGEGLSEAEKEHIFDRFYRVDKARSRETGGTGLGLSIALPLVRAHGGDIEVKSKEGEGACFIIRLPY